VIDDAELDAFQAALTELLARRLPFDEAAAILARDPAFDAHRAWVRAFDPALYRAAAVLCATWIRGGRAARETE
jgi:hypothetical protein